MSAEPAHIDSARIDSAGPSSAGLSSAAMGCTGGFAHAEWKAWSTTVRVVVRDQGSLERASEIVLEQMRRVEEAASRFRDDSEISRLDTRTGVVQQISPLLAELIAASLQVARATDGDVDPTIANALLRAGYDRDIRDLVAGPSTVPQLTDPASSLGAPRQGALRSITVSANADSVNQPPVSWRHVHLQGTRLGLPAGVRLDLGATAKAWTADRCAELVYQQTGSAVLISLGGDIATAGPAPQGGWQIAVDDDASAQELAQGPRGRRIAIPAGVAVATSSTVRRRWVKDGRERHHILDPRTGEPAVPLWRTVSVAAPSCLQANAWSTAAVVRGRIAPIWLAGLGAAARLLSPSGRVVSIGGWPS